ncbi:MAG TPA: DNA topoisomerase I [Candidatus Thermoplasmatota archaeon]|nr:DNA topoisomerase I [Candidatus Thermoplasmatota archaeon]
MMMNLIICEKNIAAKRIASILSGGSSKQKKIGSVPVYDFSSNGMDWKVVGLRGHIINLDFPSKFKIWWRIAPRNLISIDPEKRVTQKGIASALKKLLNDDVSVIVATDFDREGELIGVEAIDLVKKYNSNVSKIKRAHFSAITPSEIKDAFAQLTEVDYNLSAAGESRQVIDLIWGAVLTRFISLTSNKTGKEFLSVGRVQSPTLALLVEKEKEIQAFKPKPYWKIIAQLKKENGFEADHKNGRFWDKKEVTSIFEKIKDAEEAKVTSVEKKKRKEQPPAPFNTTSFIQAASYVRVSAAQAMKTAEELYMNGLISYPRTDNTVYPKSLDLDEILTKFKNSEFGDDVNEVLQHRRSKPMRGKKKTTDHPPIHPVDLPKKPLSGRSKKVYDLIVRRFLATLCEDALSETIHATFDIKNEPFKAKGYRLIEPRWRKIYNYIKTKEKPLPSLEEGDNIFVSKMLLKEDETKPPNRYSQGTLIGKMEDLSLGTKSTRHDIINKLYQRKYITFSPFAPTPLAVAVIDSMSDCDVVNPKMTAELEKDMDLIAEGKKTLDETIDESRKMLTKVMQELEKDKQKIKKNIKEASLKQNTIGTCPACGKDLVIRMSRRGKRFVGCTGYPKCKNTYPLPQRGVIIKTDTVCETCKTPVVQLKTRGKKPWDLCIDPDCASKENDKQKKDNKNKN